MAIAKLNKDKLKRMMGQKDAMPVNLGKKRRGDSASKLVSDEIMVRPPMIPEFTPIVQIPTTSVEVIEPAEIPSSSKMVDKAPTLALDPSLALRQVKSAVTKEDMDEYGKLNTDVVKRAPAHSLMKVSCLPLLYLIFLFLSIIIFLCIALLFVGFDRSYGHC